MSARRKPRVCGVASPGAARVTDDAARGSREAAARAAEGFELARHVLDAWVPMMAADRRTKVRAYQLAADVRGAIQMEYLVVLVFVCIPICFATVPLALAIFENYLMTRETMLYGAP